MDNSSADNAQYVNGGFTASGMPHPKGIESTFQASSSSRLCARGKSTFKAPCIGGMLTTPGPKRCTF